MSVASPGSHQCQPEMPPGVGNAPAVPGTASDVVEGEGIPATAEQEGQDQRTGAGKTIDLNDHPDLQLPGEYNHPLCQPNHTWLKRAYPEHFCGWGPTSAKNMCGWAVDLEKRGFPIAAAQQAAKALGLKTRESADCMPGCACAGCA